MNMISRCSKLLVSGRSRLPVSLLFAIFGLMLISVSASLLIARAPQPNNPRAIVKHGFTVDGRIEGSVQQLIGEDTTINDGAAITEDLFTPGTPTVLQNDNPSFGGLAQGSGSEEPAGYQVTLNGNSQLGQLIKRTDAITVTAVSAPPSGSGTRDVTLSDSDHSAGDFTTVRDLTLNGGGMLAVPAGTYRTLTANSGGGFVLGVAGAVQPSLYNLESLKLNDGSQLQVVGPIIIIAASGVTLTGPIGAESNPAWLTLKVASGDVTLNGGGTLYGVVNAPSSTITINGNSRLIGNIICDRLTVNTGGLLRIV